MRCEPRDNSGALSPSSDLAVSGDFTVKTSCLLVAVLVVLMALPLAAANAVVDGPDPIKLGSPVYKCVYTRLDPTNPIEVYDCPSP